MQFADVSFAPMQILCDDKVPCNKLLLHTGTSCKVHQNGAVFEQFRANTTQPRDSNRDSNTKLPKHCTLICLAFRFWPFHSRERNYFHPFYVCSFFTEGCLHTGMPSHMSAFTQRCFSQRYIFTYKLGVFTHKCLYAQVLLHRDAFTRRSFCTQTREYIDTNMPLHSDAFTPEHFHTLVHVFYTGFS